MLPPPRRWVTGTSWRRRPSPLSSRSEPTRSWLTHHRPIVAGDRLVAELHVDGVRAMGGGAMITTRSEIFALAPGDATDATGVREPVATTTSSILVRGEGQ
ncbi:hypothetical protein SRABI128_03657 [Microbacterium sp. Bi128]|nr:hypothetical protein SRABI128_03657 [Microbacterium sp. Bi128]